jgi:hypothetical protein
VSYVYIESEKNVYTVGFYKPGGEFVPESDCGSKEEAAARVSYLNGGTSNVVQRAAERGFRGD